MREVGLYWVMIGGEWTVAEFDGQDWAVIGREDAWDDSDFGEIGDKVTR